VVSRRSVGRFHGLRVPIDLLAYPQCHQAEQTDLGISCCIARLLDCRANLTQTPAVAQKLPFHCDARASFAVAFGNWRRKNKIQLKKIATDLGVSISTVSSWEMGERFPGGRHFEILVDYTGLPPCKLFCVMADMCVPADCLLAMSRITPKPV
jgi:hypothetical protein